jgi:hypothetical protein
MEKKMTAAKTNLVRVQMKYTEVGGKIEFTPKKLHLKENDVVEFLCKEGNLDLIFDPSDAYHPHTFRTGDPPVHVKKSAKGMIWCGGTFQIAYGGQPRTITIDPNQKQYGSSNDPGPTGGGS